jgi:hypothetical protein
MPLDDETRRVIGVIEATRHRMNASLARRLAAQAGATEQERERLLWFADYYTREADRLEGLTSSPES